MKRVLNIGLFVLLVASLTSCDYQKYNTVRQADYRATDYRKGYKAGDPEVYGDGRDCVAVQTKYKYTPNPALDGRVEKIRAKLFGNNAIARGN